MSEPVSERTTLHRYAHRAAYDRDTVDAILDEGFVCHVGLCTDGGFPVVIPLAYGRDGDTVYLHGSAASRLFRGARADRAEICMTVTFVDGLVVARSTYNTDINYRSVVILGKASEVKDLDEKRHGLDLMVDHIVPGRSRDARSPTEKELRSTMLLRLPLDECSAKVRTGFPLDEKEDYDLEIWAGVIPFRTVVDTALPDPRLRVAVAVPPYVERYQRPISVGAH
ncbi:MAG TPA: pyridoxamine 5'-phosphate oxidase family protein [Acidimicrobiales bacterium]|nr:pyridoxamine 5'-phosphate oxidase family protein [Acidimicrobiales bacterium]